MSAPALYHGLIRGLGGTGLAYAPPVDGWTGWKRALAPWVGSETSRGPGHKQQQTQLDMPLNAALYLVCRCEHAVTVRRLVL